MEIHQVVVSTSPGDAVTKAALDVRDLLRRIGPSEVFARYIHDDLVGDVLGLDSYAARPSARRGRNLLIYHASIGEPAVLSFLMERPERLVLVYHNITPARYFTTIDPPFAQLLEGGRAELAVLRDRVALALAVSGYNARELETLGYGDVRVSPLIFSVDELRAARPAPAAVRYFQENVQGPMVLFVGQLLPHKRPDLLLQTYHVLTTHLLPEAVLAMVGPSRDGRYRGVLERYAQQLNLHNAWLPGRVSQADLVAYFQAADVFMTLSEHEGVCLPLLEAMVFGAPVVARDFAAIPETLDGAGLLLPAEDDPVLAAEALYAVLTDERLRRSLRAAGDRRISTIDPDRARATFLGHLADVA